MAFSPPKVPSGEEKCCISYSWKLGKPFPLSRFLQDNLHWEKRVYLFFSSLEGTKDKGKKKNQTNPTNTGPHKIWLRTKC